MSDPNDPYSGGAVPPPGPPGGGYSAPPPPPGAPGGGYSAPPPPPGPPGGGYSAPPPPPGPPGGGYSAPPPPPGPPGGGYTPPPGPPGGGYNPPPNDGGYQAYQPGGMPAPSAGSLDLNAGFTWTIAKFQQHLVPFLSLSGIIFAVNLIGGLIVAKLADTSGNAFVVEDGNLVRESSFWAGLVGAALLGIVLALVVAFLRIGLLRAALRTTQGETPAFSDLMTGKNLVPYIIVAIVVGILSAIGLVLCVIPGLLVAFFLQFGPIHALDKGAGVSDALSWSFNAVKANIVPCLILVLIGLVVGIISAIAGGIAGTIVAALLGLVLDPISSLLTANFYRQMGREYIAP